MFSLPYQVIKYAELIFLLACHLLLILPINQDNQ